AKLTQVTVVNVNRPPVAVAQGPASAPERTLVTLDGTASSDPDTGDTLTYSWTAPAGITLSSTTAAQPTFTAPEVTADTQFTFTLTVSDGLATSAPASVTVTVTNVNRAPTANAGPDFSAPDRTVVQLHGSGTDPDNDPITFQWTAPAGITLTGAGTATPTFVAPKVKKDTPFTFSLVVTDSHGAQSAPDTVVVTVRKH
ncbi:MAG TPA: Ig-like domain-containing protein, partial [Myxococcaceae bacterium]|nr:Ig-like domain-containing protein [Myxococcaceae bacterium]